MNKAMLAQALELKTKLAQTQKELAQTIIEVDSSKGAVKITINGQQKIQQIKLSPEKIDLAKLDKLEAILLKATNEAIEKSKKLAAKRLGSLTGGFKIPGLT